MCQDGFEIDLTLSVFVSVSFSSDIFSFDRFAFSSSCSFLLVPKHAGKDVRLNQKLKTAFFLTPQHSISVSKLK
jgi:hypothetical protein